MTGHDMMGLIERLYPIPRSMTGDGVRKTLEILSEWIPLDVVEVPTGTPVLDWTVPKEWNIREAWIKDPKGEKIIDFAESTLQIVGYSVPVQTHLPLDELQDHLHSLPENPDAIPYRVSYFKETWGFCLTDSQRSRLVDGVYEVFIDSTLEDGSLTYGEFVVPGLTDSEIVLSAHTCHPSLVSDNLSGIVVAAGLARKLATGPTRRYGVRFLFAPATIGSITWLDRNPDVVDRVHAGLTLVCLADGAPLTYKRTIFGDKEIDRVASQVLASMPVPGSVIDFYPFGYDERQFNSPGFRLPFGSLMRSRHGTFPEYHTSQDNPQFASTSQLEDALNAVEQIVARLQTDRKFRNLAPRGEPQLGRRGLYTTVQNATTPKEFEYAVLWLLSLSDGNHSLSEIVDLSGIPVAVVTEAADALVDQHLLEELA